MKGSSNNKKNFKKTKAKKNNKKTQTKRTVKKVAPTKTVSKTTEIAKKTSQTVEEIKTISTTKKVKEKKELPKLKTENKASKKVSQKNTSKITPKKSKVSEKKVKDNNTFESPEIIEIIKPEIKKEKLQPRYITETELEKELREIYSDNKIDIDNPKDEIKKASKKLDDSLELPKTKTTIEQLDNFLGEQEASKLKKDIRKIITEDEKVEKRKTDVLSVIVTILAVIFTALAIFFLLLILYICEA